MDVLFQNHGAKHIYKVPEGLRELCMDISREVLRSQPDDIYDFIADYVDTLFITRENAKVAVKVVNNILLESEAMVNLLHRTGFSLEQIALAAPRLQEQFREYLDAVDTSLICDEATCHKESKLSVREILENTGATFQQAERAATIIQNAFRAHCKKMLLEEAQGKILWQKAVGNTLYILKKAGVSQEEATKAAKLIQAAYRGYYTRRNMKLQQHQRNIMDEVPEPRKTIQAIAWLEMIYEDTGLSQEEANDAATVIQKAYRKYRTKKHQREVQQVESTESMVVGAILKTLREKIFEKVLSREDIPMEYGSREDMKEAGEKLRHVFKDTLRKSRISKEDTGETAESEEKADLLKVEDQADTQEIMYDTALQETKDFEKENIEKDDGDEREMVQFLTDDIMFTDIDSLEMSKSLMEEME